MEKWVRLSKDKYRKKMEKLYEDNNKVPDRDIVEWVNRYSTSVHLVLEESENFYILAGDEGRYCSIEAVRKDEYEEVKITSV